MKKLIASVAVLGLLSGTTLATKPAHAGNAGGVIAGGIIGFAAGAIVGSQLSKNRSHRGSGRRGGSAYGTGSGLALQSDLATLGFDPGPLDGRPGGQTNAAIVAYQQTYGEIPDATLDASERRRLSARALMATLPVSYGDRDYWRHVQASLYLNGLDAGSFDGKPGRKTQNAIQQYQYQNNYTPTGQLTFDQSQALLQSAHAALRTPASPQNNWAAQPGGNSNNPTVISLPSTAAEAVTEETTIDASQSEGVPEPVFNLGNTDNSAPETAEVSEPETVEPADVTASQSVEPAPEVSAADGAQPKIHVDADGKPYIMVQGVKFYIQAAPATQAPAASPAPANDNKADVLTAQSAN